MPYCRYCGNSVSKSSNFCSRCSQAIHTGKTNLPQVYYKPLPLTEIVCSHCGNKLHRGAQFCGSCGTQNTVPKEKKLPYCVLCDELLPESSKYCTRCGIQYVEQPDGYVAIPTQPTCSKCDTLIPEESAFCTKCGSPAKNARAAHTKLTVPACRSCGTPIKTDGAFCETCGKAFTSNRSTKNGNTTNHNAQVRPIIEGSTIKCPLCGFSGMNNNRIICWRCGARFIQK